MIRLAVFASGSGTNAMNIFRHFKRHDSIHVYKMYINNSGAGLIAKAIEHDVPYHIFTRTEMNNGSLLQKLQYDKIGGIALAGFLWKVPSNLIAAFSGKILNIHPSLLPKYGGKGMYGMRVHESVIAAGEASSGITIHVVNEIYDAGKVLFQKIITLSKDESPEQLAMRIHELEYAHYPEVIESFLLRSEA